MSPHSLEEIFDNIRELGRATGSSSNAAESWIDERRERLKKIAERTGNISCRPRVFAWNGPIRSIGGHWVPEMVELAGGTDGLARKAADSVRIPWADVLKWSPEVIVFSPCRFNLEKALEQVSHLESQPGWRSFPRSATNECMRWMPILILRVPVPAWWKGPNSGRA